MLTTLLSIAGGLLLAGRMNVILARHSLLVPLSEIQSASHFVYTTDGHGNAVGVPMTAQLRDEQLDFPTMRSCGFNAVWLVEFREKLETPEGLYNLREELDNARANHLNVFLGLNYGSRFQLHADPNGEAQALSSWVYFVGTLLDQIDEYKDIVRLVVFEEGQIGTDLKYPRDANTIASKLRVTIGNLPALLHPDMRRRWQIGWYGLGTNMYSAQPAAQGFDFYCYADYFFDPSVGLTWPPKGLTDSQITAQLTRDLERVRSLYPDEHYFFAEGGYYTCSSASLDRAGQVYGLLAQFNREQGIGFNLWGWRTLYTPEEECALRGGKGGHSLTNPDGSARPALLAVSR